MELMTLRTSYSESSLPSVIIVGLGWRRVKNLLRPESRGGRLVLEVKVAVRVRVRVRVEVRVRALLVPNLTVYPNSVGFRVTARFWTRDRFIGVRVRVRFGTRVRFIGVRVWVRVRPLG